MQRSLLLLLQLIFIWASHAACAQPARVAPPKPLVFATAAELREFLRYRPSSEPLDAALVSAHRGGPAANLPENTLEAFDRSLSVDPRVIIECDVQLSRDSVLVMTHDDNLSRTAGVNKAVSSLSASDLQALPLLDREGRPSRYFMPRLADVLAWAQGKTLLTVDVKRGVPHRLVLDAIRRAKAQNCALVITYNLTDALWYHQNDPDILLSVTVRNADELAALKASGVDLSRMVAFVGTREPSRKLYDELHALGIRCILGILGNLEQRALSKTGLAGYAVIQDYVESGADILATNEVDFTRMALNYRMRR